MALVAVSYQGAKVKREASDIVERRPWNAGVEEVDRGVPTRCRSSHESLQPLRNLAAIRQPPHQAGTVGDGLSSQLVRPTAESWPRRWVRGEAKLRAKDIECAFFKFGNLLHWYGSHQRFNARD